MRNTRRNHALPTVFGFIAALIVCLFAGAPLTAQTPSLPEGKITVIYFSETGNTLRLANLLAQKTGAELYRIETETAFPKTEKEIIESEQKRRESKIPPVLKGAAPDLEGHSAVFFGCPVWYGDKPDAVALFMENLDFKGAKVGLFATAGTRPGEIIESLGASVKNGEVLSPGLVRKRADDQSDAALEKAVDEWLLALFPPK
ncbi:MAG: hypothetical protein LBF41_02055 [Deltaproteobacteria bacterium]|jgi:flavodoxin|nr:hypothetical protein [Deltaproteobacteria bacterium]